MGMTTVDQREAHRRRLLIAGAAGLNDTGGIPEGIPGMTPAQEMADDANLPDRQDLPGAAGSVDHDGPSIK